MTTQPYLEMRGISKRFAGVQALEDVNFSAFAGEAHALIGANGAGKSTLMNVLGGIIKADTGEILIQGQPVQVNSPRDAEANGIAFVHQEISMLATMTVAENLFISRFPTNAGLIQQQQMADRTVEVLRRLGSNFSPDTPVDHLSTGDRQMVEIARALLRDPGIIIFDEPTSSLTSREKERLFDVIATLKAEGVTIIYITHFLDEVFQICERATVLRSGKTVGSGLMSELTTDEIVHLMVGEVHLEQFDKKSDIETSNPMLRVTGLNRLGTLTDINFTLHQGEVLGIWGLLGSGRTELARSIVGLDPIDSGTIELQTNSGFQSVTPNEAQKWIGMITEDRRNEGLLLPMSVKENMSLANLKQLVSNLLINRRKETELADKFVDRLNIVIANLSQPVRTLSGGNQQKVIVGRWLQVNPKIFIMDEPTRGLDVGAKAEIRTIIHELAAGGAAILVISSEIEEMMRLCDRYLVLTRGTIVDVLPGDASKNDLMAAAAGVDVERTTS